MYLPDYVQFCISRLEHSGYATYAVGGCVRDALLGLTPHDYDLCTAATPAQTATVFADCALVRSGEKHGTIGVVTDGGVVEITTFRTEGSYADSRHPDFVRFVDQVELDLARRDFTVNAMAYSPTRGFCDPFDGQNDLKNRILHAVGDPNLRFTEDALRILRGMRFSTRFALTPESATQAAMCRLAPRLEQIAAERIFDELCKLLLTVNAQDLLRWAPILATVIPELAPTIGFQQHSCHHVHDVFTHTAHVVEATPAELPLRWAALLHDIGKPETLTFTPDGEGHFYGHAAISAQASDRILRRLKAPTALREQVVLLIDKHMLWLEVSYRTIRRWASRLGMETLQQLLALQEADTGGKGTEDPSQNPYFSEIRQILAQIQAENACLTLKDLAVNGHDLLSLGYAGPEIGKALQFLLDRVLDESVPNEKEALLKLLQR